MFDYVSENTKIKILISWKGRLELERYTFRESKQFSKINAFKVAYRDFSEIIHKKPNKNSILKLRLQLIRVLNVGKPIKIRLHNLFYYIFSKNIGISEIDCEKIIDTWLIRNKIENNRKYTYKKELSNIHSRCSNIMHGSIKGENLATIKRYKKTVENFFTDIENMYIHKIKSDKYLNVQLIHIGKENTNTNTAKRLSKIKRTKKSNIFFFKATYSGRRIAIIENNPDKINKITSNGYIIIERNCEKLGVFKFVDSTSFNTFINVKNIKVTHNYEIYYK